MSEFNWQCPHCEHHVTITGERQSAEQHILWIKNADGGAMLSSLFIVCPNTACRKYTLRASLNKRVDRPNGRPEVGELIEKWNLIPASSSKSFPDYIPASILTDYKEACLIQALSPKASATLSRRCLQGILRDFWKVKPGRLVDEIEQIKDKVEQLTWDAITSLRQLGNIGALMEKDINVIVDVDPHEAELLIGLIETLLAEWYVAREERKARMAALISAASSK